MANIRIKDLPAFSGTIPSNAVFALETNQAAKKVELATLREAVINIGPKTVTVNGEYQAVDDGLNGYNTVTVDVANSYTAADEGKVVQDGALEAQTSRTIELNGDYDTTLNNHVTVNVTDAPMALATLGTSTQIVPLRGIYGPMGTYAEDYITPISKQRQIVQVNASLPFEICTVFTMSQQPTSAMAIFGPLSDTFPLPSMTIDSGGTQIRYRIPTDGASAETGALMEVGDVLPLNEDIAAKISYDGAGNWGIDLAAGDVQYSQVLSDVTAYAVTGPFGLGVNVGSTLGLAGLQGAYYDIAQCYIKQSGRTIWAVSGGIVLEALEATENGTYTPPDGVDGFNTVYVNVNAGDGRCPRSEETTIYEMDDFYAWFTFVSLEE